MATETIYTSPYGDIRHSPKGTTFYNKDTGKYQSKPANYDQQKDDNARKFQELMSDMGKGSEVSDGVYRTEEGANVQLLAADRAVLNKL